MLTKNGIKLLAFDQKGWIPGPKEDEKAFFSRTNELEHFFSHPPETVDHFLTDRDWENANRQVESLYGCSPDWIVAHYSDKDLSFFQGAATWIVQKKDTRIPLIQLKKKFELGRLYKLYGRDEVLAHEAVHAIRMQFDEPKFEEVFAYQTSKRWWRRFFGPLFERPWEAYVFILLLLVPVACELLEIFDRPIPYGLYLRFLPLAFFVWLFFRLLFYRFVLRLARRKIRHLLEHPDKEWPVLLRLSDREIFSFAFCKVEKLRKKYEGDKTPRWTLLRQKFFKKMRDWM